MRGRETIDRDRDRGEAKGLLDPDTSDKRGDTAAESLLGVTCVVADDEDESERTPSTAPPLLLASLELPPPTLTPFAGIAAAAAADSLLMIVVPLEAPSTTPSSPPLPPPVPGVVMIDIDRVIFEREDEDAKGVTDDGEANRLWPARGDFGVDGDCDDELLTFMFVKSEEDV